MKGDPFENVAAAMVVGAEAPAVVGGGRHCVDDRDGRTVEERRSGRRIDLHELAGRFAAAIVAGVMVVGGSGRFVIVFVLVMGVRMEMPAADHRKNLRLVAGRRGRDVLMMPAAADQCVQQQRDGGKSGDQWTHAWMGCPSEPGRNARRIAFIGPRRADTKAYLFANRQTRR